RQAPALPVRRPSVASMIPAACSCRVSTSSIEEVRSDSIRSRFSSPGMPNTYSTPSASSAATKRSDALVTSMSPPRWMPAAYPPCRARPERRRDGRGARHLAPPRLVLPAALLERAAGGRDPRRRLAGSSRGAHGLIARVPIHRGERLGRDSAPALERVGAEELGDQRRRRAEARP